MKSWVSGLSFSLLGLCLFCATNASAFNIDHAFSASAQLDSEQKTALKAWFRDNCNLTWVIDVSDQKDSLVRCDSTKQMVTINLALSHLTSAFQFVFDKSDGNLTVETVNQQFPSWQICSDTFANPEFACHSH